MSKGKKFVAGCGIAIVIGAILCIVGNLMGGRVYGVGIGSNGLVVNTPNEENGRVSYRSGNEKLEEFKSIDIVMDYANVTIEPSDHYGIEYLVDGRTDFIFEVKDGCLNIEESFKNVYTGINFTLFSFGHFGGSYKQEYVKVYVPKEVLCTMQGSVSVVTETGNIDCRDMYADKLLLRADYGNITLNSVGSASAEIKLETGNLEMDWFEEGDLIIKCTYGNVDLDEINAADMKIVMESGNLNMEAVKGDALEVFNTYGRISVKDAAFAEDTIFEAESGDISLKSYVAGNIDIKSDYGRVEAELTDALDSYTYDLFTDYGRVKVGREDMGSSYQSREDSMSAKNIRISCGSGDITVTQK